MLKHTIVIKPRYPIKSFLWLRKEIFVPTPVVGCYQVTSYGLWSVAFSPPSFDIFFPKVILNSSQALFIHKTWWGSLMG